MKSRMLYGLSHPGALVCNILSADVTSNYVIYIYITFFGFSVIEQTLPMSISFHLSIYPNLLYIYFFEVGSERQKDFYTNKISASCELLLM